jgi:hypothetical protein
MLDVTRCPECGVPELLNQGQQWLNNGDIVQRMNPQARVGFIECENLDPVFQTMAELIGISIEPMIVNIAARSVEVYMRPLIPQQAKDMMVAKQLDPNSFEGFIFTLCHVYGFGKYETISYRYERDDKDYAIYHIIKPFSLPLAAGALAGASSSLVGGQHHITYRELSPEVYEFTTTWTEYPEEFVDRFHAQPYMHRDGDLELEACSTCGLPKGLASFRWSVDEGLIENRHTGRRMVLLEPGLQDRLFNELESELGEAIPKVVVEAQRRFTKTGFYSIDQVSDEGDFRTQLALRGLGNLREIKMGPPGLFMRIDNAAGCLMTVGMVQGLFEMAFDVRSNADWALSPEGNLQVEISPKAT